MYSVSVESPFGFNDNPNRRSIDKFIFALLVGILLVLHQLVGELHSFA